MGMEYFWPGMGMAGLVRVDTSVGRLHAQEFWYSFGPKMSSILGFSPKAWAPALPRNVLHLKGPGACNKHNKQTVRSWRRHVAP